MAGFGDTPFGLRQVRIIGSSSYIDLPVAMTLKFKETVTSGELRGNDRIVSVVTFADAGEWDLEAGGISLEAYALLTGRTSSASGTTPNQTVGLTGKAGEQFPYVKMIGKAIGPNGDDSWVQFWKCKIVDGGLEGDFKDGSFFITKLKGKAVDDGVNGVWTLLQHQTAATLPTT